MKILKRISVLFVAMMIFSQCTLTFASINNLDDIETKSCKIPTSDVYKEGIYRFDITCAKCTVNAKFITKNTSGVIIVINADNTERLYKKCTPEDTEVEIGTLTKEDTIVIVGNGEFAINFVR